MSRYIGIRDLHCKSPHDQNEDEMMTQRDGRQFWPPRGYYSMRRDDHAPMRIDLDFDPGQEEMTIDLYDEETIGTGDNLGGVVIGDRSSPLNELRHETIADFGAVYVLTYAIGERAF